MARRVVLPVPMPMMARPGPSALMVPMLLAMSGAILEPGLVTPGPRIIVSVCSAASARHEKTSANNIWLS